MESPKPIVSETPEKKLYDAATRGDVEPFKTLVQQDPFLVDQVSFARSRNLLHIATMAGQVGIVEELLRINSELARDVDSKKSSSLHIAAAEGHVEIARKLLSVAPKMLWWLDDQGMNPVHIAAMGGHVQILEVLLEHDLSPTMETLHGGQTVLHLCVKHRQLDALQFLVEKLNTLVPVTDYGGKTAFGLANRLNRVEMMEYLYGKYNTITPSEDFKVSKEITGMTMVVVGLIAAMAFQAAVSPPGGVWQDDTSSHRAGKAVMASSLPKLYKVFSRANTTAFVSSLLAIFLVTIYAPQNSHIFVTVIWYATWVAMASIGVSYGASIIITNPAETQRVGQIVAMVASGFGCIFVLVLVWIVVTKPYYKWKALKLRHDDHTIADRIFRCFYQFSRYTRYFDVIVESAKIAFKKVFGRLRKLWDEFRGHCLRRN